MLLLHPSGRVGIGASRHCFALWTDLARIRFNGFNSKTRRAQRYRLGVNHTQLPVNAPHATKAANYGRDGAMRFDANGGRGPNYEPNSFEAPKQSNESTYAPIKVRGLGGTDPQEGAQAPIRFQHSPCK